MKLSYESPGGIDRLGDNLDINERLENRIRFFHLWSF